MPSQVSVETVTDNATTAKYEVSIEIPYGYSAEDVRLYIKEAIQTWCKGGDPDDEFFWLNQKSVKVKKIAGPKGRRSKT